MSVTDNGGSAFPNANSDGMTLRDWLAGQAMTAIITEGRRRFSDVAEDAYKVADAMLKAREAGNAT